MGDDLRGGIGERGSLGDGRGESFGDSWERIGGVIGWEGSAERVCGEWPLGVILEGGSSAGEEP